MYGFLRSFLPSWISGFVDESVQIKLVVTGHTSKKKMREHVGGKIGERLEFLRVLLRDEVVG
jgi:hypothetical protein